MKLLYYVLVLTILVILISLYLYTKQKDTTASSNNDTTTSSNKDISPPAFTKENYMKIYNEAHDYTYKKWAELIGTSLNSEGKPLITKTICDKYSINMLNTGNRDTPYYEWHSEVGENGACISYPNLLIDTCDTISDQFDQPKGAFNYIPPKFSCDTDNICTITSPPTCNIPEWYCTQQLAKWRENPENCAGECYVDDATTYCGLILGDVLCRRLGQQGDIIARALISCNMGEAICVVPDNAGDAFKSTTLGEFVTAQTTSYGFLRPKNLWDPLHTGTEMVGNPKSEVFTDPTIGVIIERQPWYLVAHDSQYRTMMGFFGHYYKIRYFNYWDYLGFISRYIGNATNCKKDSEMYTLQSGKPVTIKYYPKIPISTPENPVLDIYTIDLVNFDDWASSPPKGNCLISTIIRMLSQVMTTNFSMRYFNTFAVDYEPWADRTKIFNLPYCVYKDEDKPTEILTEYPGSYGKVKDWKAYSTWRYWINIKDRRPALTKIVLMKWPQNYIYGDVNLETFIKTNIDKIKNEIFQVGEFVTISTNVTNWNEYEQTPINDRRGKYSPLILFTKGDGTIPSHGTRFSADLVVENNSLVINFGVACTRINT